MLLCISYLTTVYEYFTTGFDYKKIKVRHKSSRCRITFNIVYFLLQACPLETACISKVNYNHSLCKYNHKEREVVELDDK